MHYTVDAVASILDIHRETLQHITICNTVRHVNHDIYKTSGIPDFSKFPNLHELHLSAYNVLAEKPSEAATKLAAPLLRHLAIAFGSGDQHSVSVRDFSDEQVRWLAEFASQRQLNTKLQSVFVDFEPRWLEIHRIRPEDEILWPWEYLQQAEKELSLCHIDLKYREPVCTLDQWDQMMRDRRKEAETRRGTQSIESHL